MKRSTIIRSRQFAKNKVQRDTPTTLPRQGDRIFSFTWAKINVVLGVSIVIAIFIITFYSSFFVIKDIKLHGPLYTNTATIEGAIWDQTIVKRLGFFTQKNIFLFDINTVEKAFNNHPYIQSLSISKKLPHTINVVYTLRQPHFSVYNKTNFWTADKDGYILAVTETLDESKPIIYDPQTFYNIGDQLTIANYLKKIDLIWQAVKNNYPTEGIMPTGFLITQSATEIELYTNENWKVIFNLEGDIERQLLILRGVIKDKISDRQGLDYIDLRIDDWVYYE